MCGASRGCGPPGERIRQRAGRVGITSRIAMLIPIYPPPLPPTPQPLQFAGDTLLSTLNPTKAELWPFLAESVKLEDVEGVQTRLFLVLGDRINRLCTFLGLVTGFVVFLLAYLCMRGGREKKGSKSKKA